MFGKKNDFLSQIQLMEHSDRRLPICFKSWWFKTTYYLGLTYVGWKKVWASPQRKITSSKKPISNAFSDSFNRLMSVWPDG